MSNLGTFLYNLRKSKKISINKVSTDTGISDSVLCRIEKSQTKTPSPIILKQLAEYYSIDALRLFFEAGYIDNMHYESIFQNTDKLNQAEIAHIQQLINLLIEKGSINNEI